MKKRIVRLKGFTLIELLISLTIVGVIAGLGFVNIRSYSTQRTQSDVAQNFVSAVQNARSKAQNQVKPTTGQCTTSPLTGYKVTLSCSAVCEGYTVYVVCGGQNSSVVTQATFPGDVTVSIEQKIPSGNPTNSFLFETLTGNVSGMSDGTEVVFQSPGRSSVKVAIFQDGRITLTNEK